MLVFTCSLYGGFSSVRRIFERGWGSKKFENNETQKKNHSTQNTGPFSCPKLSEDPPQKRSTLKFSQVFGPKLNEDQKKGGPRPDSVRLGAQTFCPSYKEGGAQFSILFYANYTILATQKGGHGTMPPPLNTPWWVKPYNVAFFCCVSFLCRVLVVVEMKAWHCTSFHFNNNQHCKINNNQHSAAEL